jgi:serine/threonine protein kinase
VFAEPGLLLQMKELVLQNCRLDQRYDIREHLGRGSYAEIFLARDTLASSNSPHADVVVKALNVFLQDDLDEDLERTLVENFQNEAVALDRVRHPNVISRLGHGTARDLNGTVFHYIVLEYLSGGNLQALLRKERIQLQQALNYIEQICAGLGHAHSVGIIHRDIKPQNLLLSEDLQTVKIADFGVARVNVSDAPITRVGTNIYAPPEHSPLLAGQTAKLGTPHLTPSADVYSLAKTVYTMISGEPPRAFANHPIKSLPDSIASESWAPRLLQVLDRATSVATDQRHRTVEEFWTEIKGVGSGTDDTLPGASEPVEPQPHVTAGFTLQTPANPHFERVSENPSRLSAKLAEIPLGTSGGFTGSPDVIVQRQEPDGKKSSRSPIGLRSALTFLIAILAFTGFLFGTANYMRGRGVLPEFRNPFAARTAVANTDIYLRPAPNTENEPIGLVTKNSKVRIVNSQNNWYQIDILEQGRPRGQQLNASRGWLNGKYLDLDKN